MQITSFQKTLLGIGAGLGVIGGGAALLVARHHRTSEAEQAYRATPVSVDDFVDRTIAAFDRGTYPSPYEPIDTYSDAFRKHDGKLNLGSEDVLGEGRRFYPELVTIPEHDYYSKAITAREFLRAADTDEDGVVLRDELVAAVTPYAGADGRLDEAERRTALVDGKLAAIVDTRDVTSITGWNGGGVTTEYEAAKRVLHNVSYDVKDVKDDGSPAIRISDVKPSIPWRQGAELATGPITSLQPAMTKIDAAGNGNGLLSVREVAEWIVEHHKDPELVAGHVRNDREVFDTIIEAQQIGRIDASTLDGHVYYDTDVPKADVDRFYGGSIPKYVDGTKDFTKARGTAEWEPDPS